MKRAWTALAAAGALVATLAGAAWLTLPGLVRSTIEERGAAMLGREVRAGSVEFGPGLLAFTVRDLSVAGRRSAGEGAAGQGGAGGSAAGRPITAPSPSPFPLHITRLHLATSPASLWQAAWQRAPVFDAVEVEAPVLHLTRMASGRLDIDDIVERLRPPPDHASAAPAPPPQFRLRNVKLVGGAVTFDDQAARRVIRVTDLRLDLPRLGSGLDGEDELVESSLSLRLDGTPVALQGRSRLFGPERSADLSLVVQALDLAPWWAHAEAVRAERAGAAAWPARLARGTLDTRLTARIEAPPGQPVRVRLRGDVVLADLAATTRDGAPLAAVQRLVLPIDDAALHERRLVLGTVRLEGPQADLRRDASGRLELARLAAAARTTPTTAGQAMQARAAEAGPPRQAGQAGQGGQGGQGGQAGQAGQAGQDAAGWQVRVAAVELVDGRARWLDASARPAAAYRVERLTATAGPLQWPATEPVPLTLAATLADASGAAGTLRADGTLAPDRASLGFELDGLRLQAAAPYLRSLVTPAVSGRVAARGSVEWEAGADGAPARLAAAIARLQVDGAALAEPGAAEPSLRLRSLMLEGLDADLRQRQLRVQALRVQAPALRLERDADGVLRVQRWLAGAAGGQGGQGGQGGPMGQVGQRGQLGQVGPEGPAASSASTTRTADASARTAAASSAARPVPASAGWRWSIGRAQVDDASLQWIDRAAPAGAVAEIRAGISRAVLQGLAMPSAAPVAVQVAGTLQPPDGSTAPPGRFAARGRLGLAPLAWTGAVEVERAPVHVLEAYYADRLPVRLAHAEFGLRGDAELALTEAGPSLAVRGNLLLADVQVDARSAAGGVAAGDRLLAWQALTLQPVAVEVAPGQRPRVEIGQAQLTDLVTRLVLDERGRLTLADELAQRPEGAAPAGAGPAAPASAPADLPLDLVIGSTTLVNAAVDFRDYYIKPNYTAELTELNGTVGRISSASREMATVELRGRAARTALLEIRGAINPAVRPPALDLSARATDLELAPLSPYAGKYAGYAIERGKLSMDVAYRIEADGRLEARNQVILNQLTFGEKVDSPDATKLPVRLVVALLADRHGVIDIDLPISGSINDPQFSLWGLFWKALGNLLVKAVTAPFSLLAGGGGSQQSWVEFEPGTAVVAASGQRVVDRVAHALADRPQLRMTVVGSADAAAEREAIQAAALESRLQAEQRREMARAGQAAAPGAPLPALSPAERERLVRRLYAETPIPDRPRNVIGMLRQLPLAETEAMLRRHVVVSEGSARELALQRGLAVRDALIAKGLPSERLFLGAPRVRASAEDDPAWTPRVMLALDAPR